MKKRLLKIAVYALVAALAVGGTLAFLQDSDGDVNVMTLGNVYIDQIEQERDENGKLVPFTQDKPAYPVVGETVWAAEGVEVNGEKYKVFDATLKNVVDKIVTVNNTGKSEAYVRTVVAIEAPEYDPENLIHVNYNGTDTTSSAPVLTKINGSDYVIFTYTYKEAVAAGAKSAPSLMQVFLDEKTTNEDCAKFGEKWEILVFSQAMQTNGFASPEEALDTGFGKITPDSHPWTEGVVIPDHFVSDLDGLKEAFAEGGNVKLTADIKFEKMTPVEPGADVYLDLNGKTITVDENTKSNTLIWVKEGAKLTVAGNGTIDLEGVSTMAIFCPYGELVIENGTFKRNQITTVTNDTTGLFMGAKIAASNVTINGGYFDSGYYNKDAADIEKLLAGTEKLAETADDIAKQGKPGDKNLVRVAVKDNVSALLNHSGYGSFKVYGGTFVGANPAWGDEGCMLPTTPDYLRPWSYYQGPLLAGQTYHADKLEIPAGYTITESTLTDGRPVYTVEYNK